MSEREEFVAENIVQLLSKAQNRVERQRRVLAKMEHSRLALRRFSKQQKLALLAVMLEFSNKKVLEQPYELTNARGVVIYTIPAGTRVLAYQDSASLKLVARVLGLGRDGILTEEKFLKKYNDLQAKLGR